LFLSEHESVNIHNISVFRSNPFTSTFSIFMLSSFNSS